LRLRSPYPTPQPVQIEGPEHISGLALLRGVLLSTGDAKSAPSWAIVLTGMGLIGLFAMSTVLAYALAYGLGRVFPSVPMVGLYTFAVPVTNPDPYLGWRIAIHVIRILSVLIVLRISPVAGYHAAEHKTVNAIERTGRVDEETVRAMPKEHARCGTNLLAALAPLLLALLPDISLDPLVVVLLVVVFYGIRHHVGWWMQHVFTTKEPSQKQLRAGIKSGELLLEQWRTTPEADRPAKRLWARGLPQVLIGIGAALVILAHVERWVYELVRMGL